MGLPYPGWNVVYGEIPAASKWSQIGADLDALAAGTGLNDAVITNAKMAPLAIRPGNIDSSYFGRFRVVKSGAGAGANQGVPGGGVNVKVTYDQVLRGTFNTTNSRFIATYTGDYNIAAAIQILQASAANVDDAIFIYKNGVVYSRGGNINGTAYPALMINDVVPMVAGDFVEIYARIKSNTTLLEGSPQTAYFTGAIVP